MQWTKCLVLRTTYWTEFVTIEPGNSVFLCQKGGHPNIVGIRDTAGLLLGVKSELKSAVNTYLLTMSDVEITSCRCWFSTWCTLQGVSRFIVCCEIQYDLLNVAHLNFTQSLLLTHFYTPWKLQKTCNFLMFSGCVEIGYWHEII